MTAAAKVVLLVAAVVATGSSSCAAWDLNIIRMPTARAIEGKKIGCTLGTPCGPCSPKPDGRHVHDPFILRQL
jgi:hypothetical protein